MSLSDSSVFGVGAEMIAPMRFASPKHTQNRSGEEWQYHLSPRSLYGEGGSQADTYYSDML